MKVLITGGSGVIGWDLSKAFLHDGYKVFCTFLSNRHFVNGCIPYELDVSNKEATINLIKKIKPDLVVHTSAVTDIDLCETNHELSYRINVHGTKNIVYACKKVDSKLIFISTSAVFDSSKKIFVEDDKTNALNYYGLTKLLGENAVTSSGIDFIILRTDQPYCWVQEWHKKNTVIRVLEKLNVNTIVKEIVDWYNNPTFVDNFSEATLELVRMGKNGIYHLVGSDYVSRYEWALKIAEFFNKEKNLIQPMNSEELTLPARRANVNLSNQKVQKETSIKMFSIEEGLNSMLEQSAS